MGKMDNNDGITNYFGKYFWIARAFPALICLIPFLLFQYSYLGNLVFDKLHVLQNYSSIFHLIVTLIAIYVVSMIVRGFGKDLIEYQFFVKNNMLPTTQILLGKKVAFSEQKLMNIKNQIRRDFKIDLISKCSRKELSLRINDSVDQIRTKIGYDNKILNQYNAEYGFFRNLAGGMNIFILLTGLLIIFSSINKDHIMMSFSILLLLFAVIYCIFSRNILDNYGTKYAKQLFTEYAK